MLLFAASSSSSGLFSSSLIPNCFVFICSVRVNAYVPFYDLSTGSRGNNIDNSSLTASWARPPTKDNPSHQSTSFLDQDSTVSERSLPFRDFLSSGRVHVFFRLYFRSPGSAWCPPTGCSTWIRHYVHRYVSVNYPATPVLPGRTYAALVVLFRQMYKINVSPYGVENVYTVTDCLLMDRFSDYCDPTFGVGQHSECRSPRKIRTNTDGCCRPSTFSLLLPGPAFGVREFVVSDHARFCTDKPP